MTHNTASRVNEGGHVLLVPESRNIGFGPGSEALRDSAGALAQMVSGRKRTFIEVKKLLAT